MRWTDPSFLMLIWLSASQNVDACYSLDRTRAVALATYTRTVPLYEANSSVALIGNVLDVLVPR